MTRTILVAAATLALAAFPQHAGAQFYKGKTITMIVNYPAGGPTDIEGRIVAQHAPHCQRWAAFCLLTAKIAEADSVCVWEKLVGS